MKDKIRTERGQMSPKTREWIRDILLLLSGSFFIALALKLLYDPSHLVTGGVSGLAVIVKNLSARLPGDFTVPLWMTNALVNIPLFLLTIRTQPLRFLKKTLLATIFLTGWLYVIPYVEILPTTDFFLVSVFGGLLTGLGLALVFRADATTGGTDLVAYLIHKKFPYYSIPFALQIVDWSIVVVGAFVFGLPRSLYAMITVYITNKLTDAFLEGSKFAKMAYIISEKSDEIAEAILHDLDRGVTSLRGRGMYSGVEREVLMVVVNRREIIDVRQKAHEIDHKAFVIVSDVREVHGEGFLPIIKEEKKEKS